MKTSSAFLRAITMALLFSTGIAYAALNDPNLIGPCQLLLSNNTENFSPIHYEGVAPFAVLFQAPGAIVDSATAGSTKPFHDYLYQWNFGDPTSTTWGTSGKSKNIDTSPIAAHVYETPGLFTATVTKRNASGILSTNSYVINVEDPNSFFAGAKTTCISNTSNFIGCPVGAHPVTSNDLSDVASYVEAGERLLFRRGDTWNLSSTPNWGNNHGPVTVGAFGECTGETALGTCANDPQFTMSNGDSFMLLHECWNWRIMNLHIIDGSTPLGYDPPAIRGAVDPRNILFFRNTIQGFGSAIIFSHWKGDAADKNEYYFFVENDVSQSFDNCAYIGGEYLAILGNRLYDTYDSHVLRVWQSYIDVVAHNDISGASKESEAGNRAALKFHGPEESLIDNGELGSELDHRSKFTVVSDNIFGSSGPWPVNICPQNAQNDERIRDIIVEHNRFIPDYGSASNTLVRDGLHLAGSYFTIRNNIFEGTSAKEYYYGVRIEHRGAEPYPNEMRIFNNTVYSTTNHTTQAYGIWVDDVATNIEIRNNLVSFPNTNGTKGILTDLSGEAESSHNVITNTPYLTAPSLPNPILRDFHLTSESTLAIDTGTDVPVYIDFEGETRSSPYEIGAFHY